MVPSQWATQILGQNLLLGLSLHLDTALSRAQPGTQQSRRSLAVAAYPPRRQRSRYALPSAFYCAMPLLASDSSSASSSSS